MNVNLTLKFVSKVVSVFLVIWPLWGFSQNNAPVDLTEAIKSKIVQVQVRCTGGLGQPNLELQLNNLKSQEVRVKVPPGLLFEAKKSALQNLMTMEEKVVSVRASSSAVINLRGYCTEATDHAPSKRAEYTFAGLASSELKSLADKLHKHDFLKEEYGQMFIWAITNNRSLYSIYVPDVMKSAAEEALQYVLTITNNSGNNVKVSTKGVRIETRVVDSPRLSLFSKRAILTFHNPTDQVASCKLFNSQGVEIGKLFEGELLTHGIHEFDMSVNDMVPSGTNPVYFLKVLTPDGKVLAQKEIRNDTPFKPTNTHEIKFLFSYELKSSVSEARLKIYRQDKTLVEEFKTYKNLKPGNYNINVTFTHFYPPDTPFIARMESADGQVLHVQVLNGKK